MSTPNYESLRRMPVSPISYNNNNDLFPPYYSHTRDSSRARSDVSSSSGTTETAPHPVPSVKNTNRDDAHDVEKTKGSKGKPEWKGLSHFFLEVLPRGWSMEVLSCIMSLAALIALVIVLKEYDQQTMPSWPLGITLNTLLAFLTAVSQAGFVNPVFQGLSQMKWNWFADKDRPLADFEKFDNASRGSWGSFLLVFTMKGRLSVLMATVILVSSTITSTITQAMLTQGTRYIPGDGIAHVYNMVNDSGSIESPTWITSNILSAIFTPMNSTILEYTQPICTTGNCKFPIFSSLAMCVDTYDITDKLMTKVTAEQCCKPVINETNKWEPWTWPKVCHNCSRAGLSRDAYVYLTPWVESPLNSSNMFVQDYFDGAGDQSAWDRLYTFSNQSFGYNGVLGTHIIYLNESDIASESLPTNGNTPFFMAHTRAVEALFYMCVETYNVTVVNGTASTSVISTIKHATDLIHWGFMSDGKPNMLYNRTFTVDGHNYTYADATTSIPQILTDIVTGAFFTNQNFNGLSGMTPYSYALGQSLYTNTSLNNVTGVERDQLMRQNIENILGNMARGMTNWFRSVYPSPVQGQNYVPDTYVIVRWPFITCLAIQVILSTIFLVWVMLDTRMRKIGILKESALAALFAIPAEDRATLYNRLSTVKDERNAIGQVGNSSTASLAKGAYGQWNLKLTR